MDSDEKLKERVQFIHESIGTAAIVEQYVEGREIYVGILGNQALQALPVWELFFKNMPDGAKHIATERVKWSVNYQNKYGIDSGPALDLPEAKNDEILHLCKRAYRALELSGYARIDLRLDEAGNVWVLEANPNPQIARGESTLRASAQKAGLTYEASITEAHHQFGYALAARECRVSTAQMANPTSASGRNGMNIANNALNSAKTMTPATNSMMMGSNIRPKTSLNTDLEGSRTEGGRERSSSQEHIPTCMAAAFRSSRGLEAGRPGRAGPFGVR